jgi:membrane protease subunit (stomatin/prohibitin family)
MQGKTRRYHRPMRRLLILVMIALLPLRGWAGDLMGIQMATSGSGSMVTQAMPPGCPMHAQASQAHPEPDKGGPQTQGDMKNCASCGLCIPLAELAFTRPDIVSLAKHVQPLIGDVDFVSASLAPTVTPPIF